MIVNYFGVRASLLLVMAALSACSSLPEKPELSYNIDQQQALYDLHYWSFDGRIAVTKQQNTWQANIVWQHSPERETIKLSGPLGQGATLVEVTDEQVVIDRGGDIEQSTQVEAFINQKLGLRVPINALRYWVVGLPQHHYKFTPASQGFSQFDYTVDYKTLQTVSHYVLPHKIAIVNQDVKLKLVIDQWTLHDK